jgi:CheY-like chemotaxis protein
MAAALQAEMRLRRAAEERIQVVEEELNQCASQMRALTCELIRTELRERMRIAGRLQVHLQQLLAAARYRATLLARDAGGQVGQTAAVIRELLADSVEESRQLAVEFSPPVLQGCSLPAALHWLARWMEKRHRLKVKLVVGPGSQTVCEDARILLFECVQELLLNVVRHAGTGSAEVCLHRLPQDQVCVVVLDRGRGFDPEAAGPCDSYGGGTGLSHVRERLAWFGGHVEIESHPGQGARISLTVASGKEGKPRKADAGSAGVTRRKPPKTAGSGKIRVLLADDHAVMREGLVMLLQEEPDMEIVDEVSDGLMAVEMARKLRPNVVVMDLNMPKVNGIEATKRIRAELPDVRIVGLSMFEDPYKAQAMLDAGAQAYLTKSEPAEAVVSAIRAVMRTS